MGETGTSVWLSGVRTLLDRLEATHERFVVGAAKP